MSRHRARRPAPEPADPPEPWGSHRYRYRLYLEIDRRLRYLQEERDLEQQKAPGLSTGGSACSADKARDELGD
jgi:hypothetical protein